MKEHTYDLSEHLTQHFTLREMLYSYTAQRLGMLNPIDSPAVVDNLRMLCQQVLEPLRTAMNEPIIISSGYRSDCLNYVVGGSPNSQHRRGEAADIYCREEWQARFYYDFMRLHLPFDQLLLEHRKKNNAWWVHVSYTTRHELRRDARLMEL
jgi:hypothetical protein